MTDAGQAPARMYAPQQPSRPRRLEAPLPTAGSTLEHVGGDMPDLRAAALVGKALRGVLMSGYRQSGQEATLPSVVSGHAADGSPLSAAASCDRSARLSWNAIRGRARDRLRADPAG